MIQVFFLLFIGQEITTLPAENGLETTMCFTEKNIVLKHARVRKVVNCSLSWQLESDLNTKTNWMIE